MFYLGYPGQMVGIKCPTAQRVNSSERYSFATTLGGQVKAQAGPATRRTWDISLGSLTTPSEVGALMDFANGSWGSGPFHFLPTDAPVVNMLTEDAAACDPEVVDGDLLGSPPMPLGEHGYAPRSIWKTQNNEVSLPAVPTIPGRVVTGSAWVIGGGTVRLKFWTTAGRLISSHNSLPGGATPRRLHVTADTPSDAVLAQLTLTSGVTQASRPAITLTDQPYEWGDGQGCEKAVVHATNRSVTKAWDDPRTGRWSDLSFIVQEVG